MDSHASEPDDLVDEPASAHLVAAIEPRGGSRLARTARTLTNVALGLVTGDGESGPSEVVVVVRRRETGRQVLRVLAGSMIEADQLLQRVRTDLGEKTVAEFVSEWRVISDGVG